MRKAFRMALREQAMADFKAQWSKSRCPLQKRTFTMITIEIPAASSPYSIAVAPDSSLRNATTRDM
jgi:hypothetical protein